MKHVIANFKSNKTNQEYEQWLHTFLASNPSSATEVILAPSFPALPIFAAQTLPPHIKLGVQDISSYPAGAYTGAINVINLKELHVTHAIVGHSERRKYFHETSADVAKKVSLCIENGITPIVCVTSDQINEQANVLHENERKNIMVAFEPVENIGTGQAATLEHILEVKKHVATAFGSVPFIYGGSVDMHTDSALLQHPDLDGFLVGSASLDAVKFHELLRFIK